MFLETLLLNGSVLCSVPMTPLRRTLGWLPLTTAVLVAVLAPAVVVLAQQTPALGEPVVVVSAPWGSALRVNGMAGGRLIAPGRVSATALVWSDNPTFIDTLYDSGAWLVLNGDLSGVLCRPSNKRTS